jgi:uncharacterized protein (DUF433 family)
LDCNIPKNLPEDSSQYWTLKITLPSHHRKLIIMEKLLKRITIYPDICHGKPTIRNMRYPVEMILDLLSSGMTTQEIINDYPAIEPHLIISCGVYPC